MIPAILQAATTEPPLEQSKLVLLGALAIFAVGHAIQMVVRVLKLRGADAAAQPGMLKQRLGTPMLVENRADADCSLGMDALAKAAPDGSTTGF